ncbi:hypothetical protein SS05631_c32990 [Sinorhizobium sp. CCBAU 05631]|nr:hypothetical protein SS05631_c32990 [Sinorhizobium sp. CCBAU 05631]
MTLFRVLRTLRKTILGKLIFKTDLITRLDGRELPDIPGSEARR